jgi:hypothetical protein
MEGANRLVSVSHADWPSLRGQVNATKHPSNCDHRATSGKPEKASKRRAKKRP